ncbi:PREDICTED: heterochromatin protein 1-like isoform X2 [Polistes dominula]|uniref:Heterochromatin protein 1-like isoform X2 n=1 Tax=Polistes dominula TaxID=743375 RepID=A0ABM1ICA6_POLDO|nr:PREDICTED: heterochromatin protein 1-like isoform X2 [Polistes dominula]
MRRLSMRTKRKKSERNSESETEENGDESSKQNDMSNSEISNDENNKKDKENESEENEDLNNTPNRKSGGKKQRLSRTRHTEEQKTASPTNSKQASKTKKQLEDSDDMKTNTDQENGAVNRRGANKRRKKDEQKESPTSSRGAVSGEEEYEVDKIVGHRTIKGRRQFLIRWKGYGKESDSWEQEKDLNCPKLIENFLLDENESEETISEKTTKPSKTKSVKADKKKEMKKSKDNKRQSTMSEEEEPDTDSIKNDENQKEFEVDKIIEVHFRKNKKREFLIRWKGFSAADDTWEPEENLNCPDLISKFMDKVEKAKTTQMRELRTNPAHTKRYTLSTHDSGRRLSRRHIDKQRTKK